MPEIISEPTILDILQNREKEMLLSQRKNVILLLGETGTGKSTLAHFIAKDNKTLKSIKKSAGQFLIIDDDGKISRETTNSKTTIPELVEDINNTDLAIYDCPGFHDSRDTETDISNAYSIHKIMEHSDNFKIIFVIDYHSVEEGVDRRSFIKLIQNASNIIKNIGNFKKSIAAIITQVENIMEEKEDGSDTLVSDEDILNGIGKFLQDVRQEISTEKSYYENAISLIDILLIKNGENYQRLAIFRCPRRAGNVSEIDSLQTCRKNILKVLNENIVFTRKGKTEFGYTISDSSKNEIFHWIDKINIKVCHIFDNIGKEVITNFKLTELQIVDLSDTIEFFNSAHNCFYKLKAKLKENVNLEEITDLLTQIINDLRVEIPANIRIIQDCDKQLSFLIKISESNLNVRSSAWEKGFDNLFGYLNESKEWYRFLNTVYETLSTYNVQKDTNKFNIGNLEDLYNSWIREELNKTGADFMDLFTNIFNTDDNNNNQLLEFSDNIANITIDEIKLRHLLNILLHTLKCNLTYVSTDPSKIQIVGKYIILSHISNEILSTDRKNIEFFASEKVFIDQDLNFEGKEKNVIIAANEWIIINNKTINLNGLSGVPHMLTKAKDGEEFGGNGENGLPGEPGGPAGSFFGIGNKYVNIQSLTITANGGNGGAGQDGGKGSGGNNGHDAIIPTDPTRESTAVAQLQSLNLRFTKIEDNNYFVNNVLGYVSTEVFKIFGFSGGRGGDGGNGGCGGYGGVKGKINFIDLSDVIPQPLKNFKSENIMGRMGSNGYGGDAGDGGYNGKCVIAKYDVYRIPNALTVGTTITAPEVGLATAYVSNKLPVKWSKVTEERQNRCESGKVGLTNNIAIMDNTEESYVEIENISEIIDNYKLLLEDNLSDTIIKKLHLEFISKLDSNIINNIAMS